MRVSRQRLACLFLGEHFPVCHYRLNLGGISGLTGFRQSVLTSLQRAISACQCSGRERGWKVTTVCSGQPVLILCVSLFPEKRLVFKARLSKQQPTCTPLSTHEDRFPTQTHTRTQTHTSLSSKQGGETHEGRLFWIWLCTFLRIWQHSVRVCLCVCLRILACLGGSEVRAFLQCVSVWKGKPPRWKVKLWHALPNLATLSDSPYYHFMGITHSPYVCMQTTPCSPTPPLKGRRLTQPGKHCYFQPQKIKKERPSGCLEGCFQKVQRVSFSPSLAAVWFAFRSCLFFKL